MDSDLELPWEVSPSCQRLHVFNQSVGKLQRRLCKEEYTLLKHLPVSESRFTR